MYVSQLIFQDPWTKLVRSVSNTKQWHVALVIFSPRSRLLNLHSATQRSAGTRNMDFTMECRMSHILARPSSLKDPTMVRTTQIDHEVWISFNDFYKITRSDHAFLISAAIVVTGVWYVFYLLNCRFWSHNSALNLNPASWVTTETNAEGSTSLEDEACARLILRFPFFQVS